MITVANRAAPQDPTGRDALQQAEKSAAASQPGSFDDEALSDKVAHIPPRDKGQAPIEGLAPRPPR